ncbi:MAG: TonB-dependent receptor domain-containing protein, partial [Vicinamibacteraceae bacterium]
DLFGLPGTNGPNRFEGGMPRFEVEDYATYGVDSAVMPYYRSDDQIQTVVNVNWVKGSHNVRMGMDFYHQAMNHTQPEGGQGARGGFTFEGGPTQLRDGPSGSNFNSWAGFLLGLPTETGRLKEVDAPYTTRNRQYSLYIRDQWQATPKLTISYGTRWEYFPIPTRADRGIERYNPETNMMEIGGVGSIPKDLGIEVSKTMFAPRVGMVYRVTPTTIVRAGFGITNDPFALARPHRTNHPVVLNLTVPSAHSWTWASPLSVGIPLIPDPDLGDGVIPVPSDVGARAIPDEFERGHIKSWNVAFQRELPWGFVGEVAYVATRQEDQLGSLELNWSPIDGGQDGLQLNQRFGRTASTPITAPIGDSKYDSLQTRLERRFADGFQVGVTYTYSRNEGIAGAPNTGNTANIQIPEFYHLNYGRSDIDRPHAFSLTSVVQLPFGQGRRWLNRPGILPAIVGGWQTNNVITYFSGSPFSVTSSDDSLNAPESEQRADMVRDPRILGGIGQGNAYFDPLAFQPVTDARFGTAPWNALYGPGFWSWDFGLFREFQLSGRTTLQFRFEGFNMLNSPRFESPGGNVSNLQLNPDGSVSDLNGFTEITETMAGSERQIRLGLRLGF